MNSNYYVPFCDFFIFLKICKICKIFYFKKMYMCQAHIMTRVILWFFLNLIFFNLKKFHVLSEYHATCHSQFFIFNMVLIFVICFQFGPNSFLKFSIFVPLQIETKFNLYIIVIWIFLLKCIFLLNIFNLELELV